MDFKDQGVSIFGLSNRRSLNMQNDVVLEGSSSYFDKVLNVDLHNKDMNNAMNFKMFYPYETIDETPNYKKENHSLMEIV